MAADPKYEHWTSDRRYAEAIRLITEEGWSSRKTSERLGISRSWLREALKEHHAKAEEQEARSNLARQERMTVERDTSPALQVTNEVRRVPPPTEFMRRYFGNLECPDCGKHHDPPGFHDEMISKIADPAIKRLLINVAPFHAKSTVGTVFSTLYEICRDPNSRTAIVSKSHRLAERFLRQIQNFLVNPDLYEGAEGNLIDDWGPFVDGRGGLGSKTEFYVAGRQSAEKDPTVSAYGIDAQIYGTRFDRIINDDIADLENQKNPDRVAEMLLKITQEHQSRVGKNGKLIIVGTRVSPGDIYSHLKELPGYEVMRYPCIIDEDEGQTLWPEHFGIEAAKSVRGTMSSEQFELVYQNSELAGLGASFTPEQLHRCHDPALALGMVPPDVVLVAGLDPGGANEQAGYTAMVLMGVDLTTGMHYLVDMVNHKQMKAPQVLDQIKDWAAKYPQMRELRVETNGFAAQLYQYNFELQSFLGNKGIRFAPHITHGRNKWDAQFGVEAMAPLFHNQVIKIPWGDLWSRRQFQHLEDQLVRFPAGKPDDLVMAAWFAWLGCKELYQRSAVPAFDNRRQLPSRVARRRRVVDFGGGEVRKLTAQDLNGLFGEAAPRREKEFMNVGGVTLY